MDAQITSHPFKHIADLGGGGDSARGETDRALNASKAGEARSFRAFRVQAQWPIGTHSVELSSLRGAGLEVRLWNDTPRESCSRA